MSRVGEVTVLSNAQKTTQSQGKRRNRNMKEQGKTPEIDLSEIDISDLPGREFKIIVIKMLTQGQESDA